MVFPLGVHSAARGPFSWHSLPKMVLFGTKRAIFGPSLIRSGLLWANIISILGRNCTWGVWNVTHKDVCEECRKATFVTPTIPRQRESKISNESFQGVCLKPNGELDDGKEDFKCTLKNFLDEDCQMCKIAAKLIYYH